MTISIYQSSDTDAPVLTGQAGTLKTVLKACLVSGYGATPGKGWELLFENGDKIAFRSSEMSSTKCVIKIDDTIGYKANLFAYHSMSDIETSVNSFNHPTANIAKQYQGSVSAPRAWTVIASDKAFYVFTQAQSNRTHNDVLFFGDFTSFLPTDAFNCMMVCSQYTAVHIRDSMQTKVNHYYCASDASQLNPKKTLQLSSMSDIRGGQTLPQWTYPSTITNGAAFFPVYLSESFGGSHDYRGILPGLMLTPFGVSQAVADNTILSNVAGLPTGQRIMVKHLCHWQGTGAIAINIDNWD